MREFDRQSYKLQYSVLRGVMSACMWIIMLSALTQVAIAQQPAAIEPPTVSPATNSAIEPALDDDGRYRIGPGDVIDVRVFGWPQFSREGVRVDARGMILMPLISDEVKAGCRTETELGQEITKLYLKYLKNPQVDVFVKEFSSQPVAVIGAVNSPGRFQLRRQVRLLELLSYAGGPSPRAGRSVQVIHANSSGGCDAPPTDEQPIAASIQSAGGEPVVAEAAATESNNIETFALSDMLRGDEKANPYVRAGDLVTIVDIDQAFVIGNVLRPITIPLKDPVTVRQAIAMAGGTLANTKTDKVRIVRQTRTGNKEIYVDLKAIDKRGAEDIALQVNDIVDVPVSGGRRMLSRIANALAPATALLPIRIIR